jgi:ubiquinone/menaquinone biosynthesis C-methylase UbiE
MHLAERKMQIKESKVSRYDFDFLADRYDTWFADRPGAMYDRLEKKAISRYLSPDAKGKKLLEVGCGTGHWSRFFCECGLNVTGIDISKRMIDIAKAKNIPNASFQVADGHCLPFPDDTFDVTAAITTLEFVRDPESVVAQMVRCTRKRVGEVLVGVLNRRASLNHRRKKDSQGLWAAARLFSPEELEQLLQPYGRAEINVAGFVPTQTWLMPFASCFDCIARMLGCQKGAFIAAVLEL